MLESVQNVLSRIQEIRERFGAFSSAVAQKVTNPSFQEALQEAVKGQQVMANEEKFSSLIEACSKKYGLDPNLVRAVIKTESNFNPKAVSPAGALGLMQLMPKTANSLGVTNIFEPEENIEAGTRYLRQMLDEFNQQLPLALAAYNAGPEAVKKTGGIPPFQETKNYIQKVLAYYGWNE